MLKLQLNDIKKTYRNGESVIALNGVSLKFRESEFVAILGPSGCGKTTLLNVIGGLDRYDSGDLIIGGVSTKAFKDADWDSYRNRSIGFVFQNYNLIGHQTVLQNVEIAMTLSGVSASERKQRAKQALAEVGLSSQENKKPNQLSGGQMQRVAIARALVNNPDIILADEPTGALDSQTSVQIMEILKEIATTRLVIMVTHNGDLAEKYSNRIIRLLDGEVLSDSNPPAEIEPQEGPRPATMGKFKQTSMSFVTATALSFKNLLTKRGRTIITSFAGSIGIIGVALVLALSSGLSAYMGTMQTEALAGFPITINTTEQSFDMASRNPLTGRGHGTFPYAEYPESDTVYSYDSSKSQQRHINVLTEDYLTYIENLPMALPGTVNNIAYQRGVRMNILANTGDAVVRFDTNSHRGAAMGNPAAAMIGGSIWQESPDNKDFILSLYDLIDDGSRLPSAKNEIAIVVDKYNRLPASLLSALGMGNQTYTINDFLGKSMLKVVGNDDYYTLNGSLFTSASAADYAPLYDSESGIELTIVGVLRVKPDAGSEYFSQGFVYTAALTNYVIETAQNSEIAKAQLGNDRNVLTGVPFADDKAQKTALLMLGANTTPTGISIYPVDFAAKDSIKSYLDDYNDNKLEADRVVYSDMAQTISNMTSTLLSTTSYVLIGFAAISLLVSTIMIGIITYVSVIERTKEIGVLRSVGARKKDISRVFNAEALIIGFAAGVLGIGLTYLLSIPINSMIFRLTGIGSIASLSPAKAVVLILGSMALTLIAGFFPSRIAAKKDPVEALRTE